MIEILALPCWKVEDTPLSAWSDAFARLGHESRVTRESAGVSWIEVDALKLRGYVVMDGLTIEAINFELDETDPNAARDALSLAAAALSWELHEDDDENEDDDH
jgi:hypothetical protein